MPNTHATKGSTVKFTEEKTKIYAFNWRTIVNPFLNEDGDDNVDTKAVPTLLLEDLSSKESAVVKWAGK
ncbi:hypothetical protein DKL61_05675 [Gammaproteobacteria bacterium ESL0073]|nr:hypothetical protein DKL61_05675 [Gammaproteobacteria bacterium ESL0073]